MGGRPPTRFIKAPLLVGKFECSELCRQIDNELNNAVEILNGVNNDDVNTNNLVESVIKYAFGIDPNNDFNRVHKRKLTPKGLDLNSQTTFEQKTFYRAVQKRFRHFNYTSSERFKNVRFL